MKEQDIQSQILKYLNSIGYARKIASFISGTPDIFALVKGKFFAFEVKKSASDKPSELQKYNIEEINKNGGHANIVWSLQQVKDIIDETVTTSNNKSR